MSGGVRTEGTRSLAYGLGVLRAFDGQHPVRSISELAELIGVSRPTAYRYAVTLLELGYLEQAPMRRYRLAPRAAQLGVAMIDVLPVVGRARPIVRRLRQSTGATMSLAVLDGEDVVYLLRSRGYLQGSYELSRHIGAGTRVPASSTPAGLALTAWRERRAGRSDGAGGLAIVVDGEPTPAALEMIVPGRIMADQKSVADLTERLGKAAARLSSATDGRRRG